MTFLSEMQLRALGFASVGADVCVSDRCSIYGAERIALGERCRIDDFAVLSAGAGGIRIGRNVHVACYTSLIGAAAIAIGDFANLSARVSIYSSSDDYSGCAMTNPTVPPAFTGVRHGPVTLGRHVIVGCGAVILPSVVLGDGCAIGALSLVKDDCGEFGVFGGIPARYLKPRARDLLQCEADYLAFREAASSSNEPG